MLRVTVVGALLELRDALVAALALQAANTGASYHVTTQPGGDLTLLLGLRQSDALPGNAADLADQSLRSQLNDADQPYQVLYGVLDQQVAQAAHLIRLHQPTKLTTAAPMTPAPTQKANWRWACDKCSDPGCEHKLLTDLLAHRVPKIQTPS